MPSPDAQSIRAEEDCKDFAHIAPGLLTVIGVVPGLARSWWPYWEPSRRPVVPPAFAGAVPSVPTSAHSITPRP